MAKILDFDGVKTYRDFDVYNFKNKEVMFDEPTYIVLAISKLANLSMCEYTYNNLILYNFPAA